MNLNATDIGLCEMGGDEGIIGGGSNLQIDPVVLRN
jgi:hypothetical protein